MATIDSLLLDSANRYPDRPALNFSRQDLSYRELNAAVDRLATRLAEEAASAGTAAAHIGIIAPNVPALVVALFAAWRSGAVTVPINARLREYELGRILGDAQVTTLVSIGAYRGYSFASILPEICARLPSVRALLFVDPMGEVEEAVSRQPSAVSGQHSADSCDLSADRSIGALLYTSGTTGAPKGALVTHEREIGGAHKMSSVLGLTPDDVCMFVVPISHAFGMTCLLSTIAAGSRAVLVESTFSIEPMVSAIKQQQGTIMHGSPALFTSFLKAAPKGIPTLRTGFVAGAACPPHVLEQLDDAGIRILNLYGMTEIGAAACCRSHDPPQVRYTTSGSPLPGYEFRIVPPPSHEPRAVSHELTAHGSQLTAHSSIGEIQVRGPYVTPGYYREPEPGNRRQPEQTDQAFDQGWFRTGDLGELDAQGHVRISGRAKEVIQVAGLNVFPAEVEGFLLTHPDVVQTAVVGTPHETMGEVLRAFVVTRPGSDLTPTTLLQYARSQIAGYKLPYDIQIVPELPLLPSGKPDKRALTRSGTAP